MKMILSKKGFTMVETLVAIAILMIAIAGPLTIAQKGLTAAVYARDQVIASFLAQDAMEYIKNVRDYNISTGSSNWLTYIDSCTSGSHCNVNTISNNISTSISQCGLNCPLYLSDDGGYTTSVTIKKSQFSRSFYIEQNPPAVSVGNLGKEARVIVQVTWKNNGSILNVVTFENQMFNITR